MIEYERVIITQDDYEVIFSNTGNKLHGNPNPTNFSKQELACQSPGCTKTTKSVFGFCSLHNTSKFKKEFKHLKDWIGELRCTSSIERIQEPVELDKSTPLLKAYATPHVELTEYLLRWAGRDEEKIAALDRLVLCALEQIVGAIPDATTLQQYLEGINTRDESTKHVQTTLRDKTTASDSKNEYHPDTVARIICTIVNESLPKAEFDRELIEPVRIRLDDIEFMSSVPLRIVAALLVTAWACEESNRGDLWFRRIHNYRPDKPTRASAYMSATYYFMRRYAGCLEAQAKIIVRSMS